MTWRKADEAAGAPPDRRASALGRQPDSSIKALLANRNFAALFVGQTMSQAGDQFVLIAALSLINQVLDSQLALAGIAMALSLPRLPLSLFAGVVVDRWNRKHLMIAADLLRGAIVLLPLLIRRPEQIWILYLTAVGLGVLTTFFEPARNAVIPNIVSEEQLFLANGMVQVSFIVGTIAGAAAAGFAVDAFGPFYAFAVDSATFAFSAAAIALVTVPKRPAQRSRATAQELWRQLKEGVHFIRFNGMLLRIMVVTSIAALGLSALMILGIGYLERDLGVGASGFGVVVAAVGVGVALGAAAVRWLVQRVSLLTLVGGCLGLVGLAIMSFTLLPYYETVVLGAVLVGIGVVIARAGLATMTQKLTPDRMRGRVESAVNMIIGVSSVGAQGASGVLGELLSAQIVFLGAGAITAAAGAAILWPHRRPRTG
ncbi:MAG: MFS transporter [Anaerolineales bacterium]|nr:MFS transporter [Anaerolineales bacterium]